MLHRTGGRALPAPAYPPGAGAGRHETPDPPAPGPYQCRETACQGYKIFMIRDLLLDLTVVPKTARAALIRRVDIHEVHIGGKVQLVATEFAHTNNAEATGMLYPISTSVHGDAIQRRQPAYARLKPCL